MLLASEFSLNDSLLTLLWLFMLVIFFWLLISIFADLFRSHDLSGGAKALWVLFIVVLPFIGILIYLVARGGKMHERALAQQHKAEAAFHDYVQDVAGGGSVADEVTKLAALKDKGAISDEEFQRLKAKAMGS